MTEEDPKKLFWYRVKFTALILVFISPFIGGWLALYVFEPHNSMKNPTLALVEKRAASS